MFAQNFYVVAENLLDNQPNDEATLRTVVGRAYYAVYLLTRDWIDSRFPDEIRVAEGRSHERYTNCLNSLQRKFKDLQLSCFARELTNLKDKRHFADYCISSSDIQGEANTKEAILQAKKLLNDLKKLQDKYC
ncbi:MULTISPECIES: hypothetical protein [unclassified Acinetobacter]|uniref:hypothetical protein n=1 Tax=unclassified Acinetobacter TaxID=196816 RepID=UPI002934FDB2|nr:MULTISPECIES: hypothetical protein [unclassified Acinetobacter]WOE32184.1 hypothetical protein QSG84_02925 [Acinetobacter sp. SAAs470]WOE37654.1 hypothetical protein QSG86_11970 [Acinetobacter sp. SAAs474]